MDVLSLPWDRESAVGDAVAAMRARSAFTDVNLVCHDSVVVRAHQAVLAPLSPLLASLFRAHSCCACAGANCCSASDEATLLVPWVSAQSATMLLCLIYTGRASVTADREKKELLKLIAALDLKLPEEVEATLMEATRKRKAEELMTREEKRKKETVRNSDGVFECWRCGATYASERSHHAHSILCSKKHKRVEEAEDDGVIVIEDEEKEVQDVTETNYIEGRSIGGTTRVVCTTEVTLEQIQVKEEPLDADGHVVALHTCRYCLMAMRTRNGLLQHLCVDHFGRHLKQAYGHLTACPDCGFTPKSNAHLLKHLGVEHSKVARYVKFCQESPEDLCCPHCDEAFEDPELLVVHLATEHYQRNLELMYPLDSKCPMCETALEEPYFYLHLIRKHFALFSVLPRRVCDQLLRIMTDEMLETRENFGTHASKAPESVDDEVTPDINLVCPVCEKIFAVKEELKEDLAGHYSGELKKLFGSNLGGRCPFCRKEGLSGDDGVMVHIATAHDQLRRVLPKEVARLVLKKLFD